MRKLSRTIPSLSLDEEGFPSQSCSLESQKWIFGIATHALPECEELSEVQCRHLTACKEPCPYGSSGPYPVCMIDVSEYRRNGFNSVSDLAIELVSLAFHFLLKICTVTFIPGNHHNCRSLVQLGLAFVPMRAILALIEEKRGSCTKTV